MQKESNDYENSFIWIPVIKRPSFIGIWTKKDYMTKNSAVVQSLSRV